MPKKVCPNGHIHDSSIYGDECPLCPKGGEETQYVQRPDMGMPPYNQVAEPATGIGTQVGSPGGGTQVNPPAGGAFQGGAGNFPMGGGTVGANANSAEGETIIRPQQQPQQPRAGVVGGGTVIRQPKGMMQAQGRKLVGFLVTYNRNPQGKAFNLYEGKNFIGRDRSCDICVPEDNQMSGRHMSILYRNVDNKFKFRDEQSSNGTFVNKELADEGELQNYDIIRLGGTVFIFIAIPKIG